MLLFVGNYAAWGNPVNFASTRYGLTFRSHTVNQDERTSLDLSPEESFNLKPGFSMSFDLQLFEANLTYGYVFRIILDEISSFDLITNLNTEKLNYVLSKSGRILKNCEFQCNKDSVTNRWIKIRIDVEENGIRCMVDSTMKIISHSLEGFENIKISFGKNRYSSFYTTDVPPIAFDTVIDTPIRGSPASSRTVPLMFLFSCCNTSKETSLVLTPELPIHVVPILSSEKAFGNQRLTNR